MKSTSFVDNLHPPKTMRDILKPMSTCNSVETWCKRAEYRVCRWRSPWLRLKSTESDRFVSLISVTKCCVTITTGLPVSVSFEDKNACVGGKGKEVVALAIPLPLHPSESSWKQKLPKRPCNRSSLCFHLIIQRYSPSMDQRNTIVS